MAVELSVIVVSHNSRDCLSDCLSSLERERAGREWDILVVDNASDDGSADMVAGSFPNVRLVRNTRNTGFAAANNLGIQKSRGRHVLFLNPDTRVLPGALDVLVRAMEARPDIGAAGPALLAGPRSFQVSFGGRVHFFKELVQKTVLNAVWKVRLKSTRRPRSVAWASGACLIVRREALEKSGGFDEGFFLYFEDIDLCYRIRQANYKVLFFPPARVFHSGGASASAVPLRSRLEYRRSQLRFYGRHASRLSQRLLRAYLGFEARAAAIFRRRDSRAKTFGRALLRLLRTGESEGRRNIIRVLEVIDKPFLGGGQRTVLLLAAGLDKRKFQVSVCSAAGGPLVRELERRGIEHVALPLEKRLSLRPVRAMRRLIRERPFDIVHTHGGVAGFYGRMAARGTGAGVVHTLHGIHYLHYGNVFLRRLFMILERWMSRSTDAVVCVSQADLDKAAALRLAPAGTLRLIKNGIDFQSAPPAGTPGRLAKELGLGRTDFVVGTVARLHRQKGLIHLLRAVPGIVKAHPRTRVVIAGGGPLRRELEAEARRLGVGDAVIFLGERADATGILGRFDVFALPSLWEGLPYVLGEAARAGCPIVATDIEGTREVIRDGENGLLVPPADSAVLERAVNGLLDDPARRRRLAAAARKSVPAHFDLDRMLELTGTLYQEIETAYNLQR